MHHMKNTGWELEAKDLFYQGFSSQGLISEVHCACFWKSLLQGSYMFLLP